MNPTAEDVLRKDCFECRVTGSLGCSAIGAFIFYQSEYGKYYQKRPLGRLAVRCLAGAAFYLSAARWFYLPPFTKFAGYNESITVHEK